MEQLEPTPTVSELVAYDVFRQTRDYASDCQSDLALAGAYVVPDRSKEKRRKYLVRNSSMSIAFCMLDEFRFDRLQRQKSVVVKQSLQLVVTRCKPFKRVRERAVTEVMTKRGKARHSIDKL